MEGNHNHKIKKVITILSVLICLSLIGVGGTQVFKSLSVEREVVSVASDNIITTASNTSASGQAVLDRLENETSNSNNIDNSMNSTTDEPTTLSLYRRHAQTNVPFEVLNMFPGDVEIRDYCVQVSYDNTVTVKFRAEVRPDVDYQKLAEVLKCKVVLTTTGETLYDGLMKEMPTSVDHVLRATASTTDELDYQITAYLDTSVGNEYQDKPLIADFIWWVEEEDNLESPKTGDIASTTLWWAIIICPAILLALLFKKRRKEARNDRN